MKKIYSFLSVMVLSLFAISANAQRTVIINVDDPERVDIRVNYTSVEGIVAGDNEVEIPQYGSFYAYAKSGCALESVRCTTTGTNYHIDNMTQAYVYVDASVEGDLKYEVKSNTLEALRTATMTVNVDDASQVSAVLSTTNERVSLVNGENTVKFIPGVESPIMIAHSTYGKVLYQVSVDDVIQEAQGQQYRLNVVDGSKVDIKANFPEGLAYRVQFSYVNEGTEDVVSAVTVDGAPIEAEKYNDPDFTVPAGKQVSITFNLQDYQLNNFKVNGTTTSTYGSYQFYPTGETTLEIDATKYAEDQVMDVALEAGADDMATEDDVHEISTSPEAFDAVTKALEAAGIEMLNAEISYVPNDPVKLDHGDAQKLLKLLDKFEDDDDVQDVYHNAEISDEDMDAAE